MINPEPQNGTNITIRVSQDFGERLARAAAGDRRANGDWIRLMLERAVEQAEMDDESQDLPHERVVADSRMAGMITPEAEEEAAKLSDADFTRAGALRSRRALVVAAVWSVRAQRDRDELHTVDEAWRVKCPIY